MNNKNLKAKTFIHPMKLTVKQGEFEPSSSLDALDFAKLKKGSHRIQIGQAKGGCCDQSLYAVIRNGMVTDLEYESCTESHAPVNKDMMALLLAARKEIGMKEPGKWRPLPVEELLSSPMEMSKIIFGLGHGCLQVCIAWGDALHCYYCCAWPPHCGSDTIATGPLNRVS